MSENITVIDLCSDEEDLEKPLHRRFDVDVIDEVDIYSFGNAIEMEFFSQHDTPFTNRDNRDFKGFRYVESSAVEYKEFFRNTIRSSKTDDDCILVSDPVVFPKPIKKSKHKKNTESNLAPNPKFPTWMSPSKPLIIRKSATATNVLFEGNIVGPPLGNAQGAMNPKQLTPRCNCQVAIDEVQSQIIYPPVTRADLNKSFRYAAGVFVHERSEPPVAATEVQAPSSVPQGQSFSSGCPTVGRDSNSRLPYSNGSSRMRRNSSKKTKSPQKPNLLPVVDDAVVSVVRDLVDFVCRKETFSEILVCQDPPPKPLPAMKAMKACQKEFCSFGCVCYSIGRKNTRRRRCQNAGCMFGCCCWANIDRLRSAFVRPPNSLQTLALPQLPSEQPALTAGGETTCSALVPKKQKPREVLTQTQLFPLKNGQIVFKDSDFSLPALKIDGTPPASTTEKTSHVSKTGKTPPVSKTDKIGLSEGLISSYKPLPFNKWKPNILQKPFYSPYEAFKKKKPFVHHLKDLPLQKPTEPQKFKLVDIGKNVDAPAQALICLTPGVGYVPLEEMTSQKVLFRDPFSPTVVVSFVNVKSAIEWLNQRFKEEFTFGPNLSNLCWMVADATIIKRKDLKRMDVKALADPKCQITRTGLVFT